MLDGHLSQGFEPDVAKLSGKLVDATIELHRHVMNNFLPSAVKFHYQFNLRELSNITQVCTSQHITSSGWAGTKVLLCGEHLLPEQK